MWKNRPLTCRVRNDRNKSAEYACSELRQPSKEACSKLGPDSVVDVLFEWKVCNTKAIAIRLDLTKSKAKFSGGAVVTEETENGIKTVNVAIRHKSKPEWTGVIEADSCEIVYAEVDINKCKATFDSEIFVVNMNSKCSAKQTTGDWILRRCQVFVSIDSTVTRCLFF